MGNVLTVEELGILINNKLLPASVVGVVGQFPKLLAKIRFCRQFTLRKLL